MVFKLSHDVVSTCAKRDEPPSRRQPLELSSLWISYTHQNSSDFVGSCGEAFLFIQCFLWTLIYLYNLCDLWFNQLHSAQLGLCQYA